MGDSEYIQAGKITVYPRKPESARFHEVRSNNYYNNYCKSLHGTVHKLFGLPEVHLSSMHGAMCVHVSCQVQGGA